LGVQKLGRSSNQHIDNEELKTLVPWPSGTDKGTMVDFPESSREAHCHLTSCAECRRKVSQYRQIVSRLSSAVASGIAAAGAECPKDVGWREVAAGLWPELKVRQLIQHAAQCDHCGPLLRAATRQAPEPLKKQKAATEPAPTAMHPSEKRWVALVWQVPSAAIAVILVALIGIRLFSPTAMTGAGYAEFAVRTHAQHARGNLSLDIRAESQQALNEWLLRHSEFAVALPASAEMPGEKRPFRLEGASLVQVGGKHASFIAYQTESGPASLMIAPDSVAVASGGVEAQFKKVTFHYRMVNGFKVVTWSQHGLTYALVSSEGTATQKSCMLCHSAMRDRDLSHTPTPLNVDSESVRSYLQ
jgi:anti-sigma factor RsiW